jgi:hypothetical protein
MYISKKYNISKITHGNIFWNMLKVPHSIYFRIIIQYVPYGKSPSLIGKSTINGPFSIAM